MGASASASANKSVRVEMRRNQCKSIATIKCEQRSVANGCGTKRGIKDDARIMLLKIIIGHYRLKSGEDVYGAATSLIFSTMMAVIKMHVTFTTVSIHEMMPLITNSAGI